MEDLNTETFSGIKKGLSEISLAIKQLPITLKDCHQVEADFGKIIKMAEIFEHPISLVFHAGKNLVVNGVDIFMKTKESITDYENKDFYNFGKFMAEAIDEIFLMKPATKNLNDAKAYDFLNGFFAGY